MTLRDGTPVLRLEKTDSTNAEAARQAAAGEAGPLWVVAARQTAARARRGRDWSSLEGNLFASYLCRPGLTPERAALATFAASLAVLDVVSALLPDGREAVTLKWPNDVLVNGRKVAGILLESSAGRDGRVAWLIIGIGINLAAAPPVGEIRPGGAAPTSVAAESGCVPAVEEAMDMLGASLTRWLARIEADGFEAVRGPWLARAARLGETIGAGLAHERLEGIFEDVDATGALVLRTRDGTVRHISAADIYFPD